MLNLLEKSKNITIVKRLYHFIDFFLKKQAFISFFLKILGVASSFIFMFFAILWAGKDNYASFSVYFNFIQILIIFCSLGIDLYIVRTAAQQKDTPELSSIILKSFQILTITSIIGIIIFLSYITLFFEEMSIDLIFLSLILLFTVFINFISGIFKGLKKIFFGIFFQKSAIYLIAVPALYVSVYFITNEEDLLRSVFISSLLSFIICLIAFFKYIHNPIKSSVSGVKSILDGSIPMMMSGAFVLLLSYTDVFFLGFFGSQNDIASYQVILKISSLAGLGLFSVNNISAPIFAEMQNKGNKIELKRYVQEMSRSVFLFSVASVIAIIVFSPFLLDFLKSNEYYTQISLFILLFGFFVNAFFGPNFIFLDMTGNEKINRNILFRALAINVFLHLILIPYIGIIGAAISNSITQIIRNIEATVFIKKKFGFSMFYVPFKK